MTGLHAYLVSSAIIGGVFGGAYAHKNAPNSGLSVARIGRGAFLGATIYPIALPILPFIYAASTHPSVLPILPHISNAAKVFVF